jgi:hypothetical protein
MLQLEVGEWKETSSLQLSKLQVCQGRYAKKKVTESAQDYNGKGPLFQPHHPRTFLHGGAAQQQPQLPSFSQAGPATLGKIIAPPPPPSKHNQQIPSQSLQAPNANSSSLNDMFKVVATILQQIMTELSGSESEEDRIVAMTNIVFKLMKQNGC